MTKEADRIDEMGFLGYTGDFAQVAVPAIGLYRDIAELARRIHVETNMHYETLAARFAALAPTHLGPVDDAGALVLFGSGPAHPVSEPGNSAQILEQLQTNLDEGPAIDALHRQRVVRVHDLATEQRWPRLRDAALAETPVRSMLCIRLDTPTRTLGVLLLHANHPGALDEEMDDPAAILATHMALALAGLHHNRHFRSALGSRDIIGQAKGILMERFGIDAVEAFSLLTRLAHESRIQVIQVAKDLLRKQSGTGGS